MKCRNCKNNTLLDDGVQFSWCEIRHDNLNVDEERWCEAFSQATNADRIRAMSDEELAEFITNTDFCELLCKNYRVCEDGRCDKRLIDWLKREVSDGDLR